MSPVMTILIVEFYRIFIPYEMNTAEFERASQYSKDINKKSLWTVNASIQAEFSDCGLISFDLF